jgi:hypothetical protein
MTWNTRRISLVAVLAIVAAGYALPAAAQWAWRDESGRTVYSDRPPPASVKSEQILRQPSAQSFGSSGGAPADSKADGKDAQKSGPKTLAEREMDFRKRQQEQAEAEKKQAEEQSRNDQRRQECERLRGYLKALEDGQRIARTDAQGNREVLDDAQREGEIKRVRDGLSRSCS